MSSAQRAAWGPRGRARRRPQLTPERIARQALAIADAEGFDAVSMRRVASELGVGTMTLYHYVRTKDDLLALMDDEIMGDVLVEPEALAHGWKRALAEIARASFAAWSRHPWAFDALRGVRFGPNGTRHFDQSAQAVSGLPVSMEERFEIIALVDDYVLGFALRWNGPWAEDASDEDWEEMLAFLDDQVRTEDLRHVREMMGDDPRAAWERTGALVRDPGRFERGLARLLDGIELDLERRGIREGPGPSPAN